MTVSRWVLLMVTLVFTVERHQTRRRNRKLFYAQTERRSWIAVTFDFCLRGRRGGIGSFVFCVLSTSENLAQENSAYFCGYFTFDFSEEEFNEKFNESLPSKVLLLTASSAPIFTGCMHGMLKRRISSICVYYWKMLVGFIWKQM